MVPLSAVCNLDKWAHHAKRVLGLEVVVWWDWVEETCRCLMTDAQLDGSLVQTFYKACAAVYLSIVQSKILWFWPNTSVEYSDIAQKEEPPCDLKLDDPSYSGVMSEDERSSLWK